MISRIPLYFPTVIIISYPVNFPIRSLVQNRLMKPIYPRGDGRGRPRKLGGGVLTVSKTLTVLFKIKICDFSYSIYNLTKTSIFDTLFMTVMAVTVALNIIYEGLS